MIEAFLITGSSQEKRSLIAVGLNNVDAMCCNPNIRLFKARLETGFHLTHMFPVLGVVFHINSHADQLVMVERALIDPTTSDDDRVRTRGPELANQFVIGFQKLLAFDGPAIVIEERE